MDTEQNKGILKSKFAKILLIIIVFISFVVGVFYKKDMFFQSKWKKDINSLVIKYNKDSDLLNNEFQSIDLSKLKDEESLNKIDNSLKSSKEYLNNVSLDIQDINNYLILETSDQEKDIKENYKICYEGRLKGLNIINIGITNSIRYLEANSYLLKYEDEIQNFIRLKNDYVIVTSQRDKQKTIDNLIKERESTLKLKEYFDRAYSIIETKSLKQQSIIYEKISEGISYLIKGFNQEDLNSITKGSNIIKEASVMIDNSRGLVSSDNQKWIDQNITSKYTEGNNELAKILNNCYKAEQASGLK